VSNSATGSSWSVSTVAAGAGVAEGSVYPFAQPTMLLASLEARRTQCLHPVKQRSLEGTLLLVGRNYGANEQSRKPVENLKLFARGLAMKLSVE